MGLNNENKIVKFNLVKNCVTYYGRCITFGSNEMCEKIQIIMLGECFDEINKRIKRFVNS